jgi:hypothetical protein
MRPPTINVGTAAPGSAPGSRQPSRVLLAGRLDPSYPLSAFPSMVAELKGSETVLTGLLEDRSAVFGVVAQIEAASNWSNSDKSGRDRHRVNHAMTAQRMACEARRTSPNPKSRT